VTSKYWEFVLPYLLLCQEDSELAQGFHYIVLAIRMTEKLKQVAIQSS